MAYHLETRQLQAYVLVVARGGHKLVKGEEGLARSLRDRPVVERTGLTGRYDAQVFWRPDGATREQLAAIPADRRPPDVNLFEAFEQQTGLKLEARREPVEVLVIDRIEQADAN